ncbi:MAG TPA: hypothetical protein PK808_03650, partial [Polymorphobacter sp.]|nr:hypothetical protein [Polymorphobacter sp.]
KNHGAAQAVFDAAIKRGMGMAPVPEWGWRLVNDGGATLAGHKIDPGAKIVLGFASAAAELGAAAATGKKVDNSYIYFGLDHRDAAVPDAKTSHGCPGRDMALGVLTGVLAALAEKVVIQPGGGRLLVDLTPRA